MTFGWACRDRLCPMRMVWPERIYNYTKYELRRVRNTHSSLAPALGSTGSREARSSSAARSTGIVPVDSANGRIGGRITGRESVLRSSIGPTPRRLAARGVARGG
jgi:hypothetical protein